MAVPVRFSIGPDGSVGFALGAYDATQPLIIDPTLVYSTYLGSAGLNEEAGVAITVDASGNTYILYANNIVDKLNPTGSAILYHTQIGSNAAGGDLALDGAGNVYLVGTTLSSSYPTLNGYQTTCNPTDTANCSPEGDAFVTKLGPSGSVLYSTYLGGADGDQGWGIAVDSSGAAYVTGISASTNFPTKTPIQTTGGIFVSKLNPAASGAASLIYSTRLGNNGTNQGWGIAVDGSGAAYVAGYTTATNFTTTAGVVRPTHTTSDGEGFVVKLNATGTARDYSTYIGGSGDDFTRRIAVDSAGHAAVIGGTTSTNLVIVNGAQTSCGDSGCTLGDGFVLQLNPTATAIRYSTYLGGTGIDDGIDLGLDGQGMLYATGAASSGFPVTPDAFRSVVSGSGDAYVTKLNPTGVGATSRVYSTLFGGNDDDIARGLAVDAVGSAYLTGSTFSTDLATAGAAKVSYSGDQTAAFVAKIGITERRISHTYDGLQRLIGTVALPGSAYGYGYDLAGNRTSVTTNGAAPAITTYNLANQITSGGVSYDLAGNLANDGTGAAQRVNPPLVRQTR